MQINKKATVLILLMVTSMIAMIPLLSTKSASATPVANPSPNPNIIAWYNYTAYAAMYTNPEFMQVECGASVPTTTLLTLEGTDTYGANIEATAVIPAGSQEQMFGFVDNHTGTPEPVAFRTVTGIYQNDGSDNVQFTIFTEPFPFKQYLGQFHAGVGIYSAWLPGQYYFGAENAPTVYGPAGREYLVSTGTAQSYVEAQNYPVEPANPDPICVYVNWHQLDGNLSPDSHASYPSTSKAGSYWISIVGLDERGAPMIVNMTIPVGVNWFPVPTPGGHTWSAVCMVNGNGPDSYYIFTNPQQPQEQLFTYTLLIDHITIQPCSYDIIANQTYFPEASETAVTVTLMDKDGNQICAGTGSPVEVNFATTGGEIDPSESVYIEPDYSQTSSYLCADTNPRTINVTALALVPACTYHKALDCFAWTEMTIDGVSSVPTQWTTIHTLMWGWNSWNLTSLGQLCTLISSYIGPVPPKPTTKNTILLTEEKYTMPILDGPVYEVMIPLFAGCNLISCPVHPVWDFIGEYLPGIPMNLVFNSTLIQSVWWYNETGWQEYIPGVTNCTQWDVFEDGRGYWVYAKESCTIEVSGVVWDDVLTPSGGVNIVNELETQYILPAYSWSLVGLTSITPMSINSYLESTNGGATVTLSAAGPVWTYYAYIDTWFRDPSWGLYPGYGFWVFNKTPAPIVLAP
jgi:hypothetical protein